MIKSIKEFELAIESISKDSAKKARKTLAEADVFADSKKPATNQNTQPEAKPKTSTTKPTPEKQKDFSGNKSEHEEAKDSVLNQGEPITSETIVAKLNVIRSGRSLKDENIAQQMEQYFTSLSEDERVTLFTFLEGISLIVNPPNDADDAPDPSDKGINIQADEKTKQQAHQQPQQQAPQQVVKQKAPAPTMSTNKSYAAPIKVKKNVP